MTSFDKISTCIEALFSGKYILRHVVFCAVVVKANQLCRERGYTTQQAMGITRGSLNINKLMDCPDCWKYKSKHSPLQIAIELMNSGIKWIIGKSIKTVEISGVEYEIVDCAELYRRLCAIYDCGLKRKCISKLM